MGFKRLPKQKYLHSVSIIVGWVGWFLLLPKAISETSHLDEL